ncbi:MAG: hypothetical protein Q9164_005584, partial [Protoblastenia rupestris]
MTRPHVIRADTIDLQDRDAPSAKDHSRQPVRPGALGEGPPAPHQADALKHVELEIAEQHGRSPRASQDLSGKELQLLHDEADSYGNHDAGENLLRNAGQHAAHDEVESGEEDEGLDDDMTDKISSSPSIGEDGGFIVPQLLWPSRIASLRSSTPEKKATHSPGPPSDDFSSSPFAETPEHFPLSFARNEQEDTPSKGHHQEGKYAVKSRKHLSVDDYEFESRDQLSPLISEQHDSNPEDKFIDAQDLYEEGHFDPNEFHHLLLPDDDPLLDNNSDDAPLEVEHASETPSPTSKASWNEVTPGEPDDDDDTEDISYSDHSRFVDSGWGGECLRETEDIDFEFVYALHTFVATVEGQANATKGDTMVLLDDSNSYWWLVRVVKDSSIGYLPAEHIETPLERLARLNKHRNLDLSQTMLGDQDEDKRANPLNPLKKAMRRRNVKKVEFAGNSYVEPSDVEYSSDEDDEGNDSFTTQEQSEAEEQRQDQQAKDTEANAIIAPLNTRDRAMNGRRKEDVAAEAEARNGIDQINTTDQRRDSDDTFERNDDGTANKSRKGTLRNTDSFFKDDSVETRKINLTPSLLRDDSTGARPGTNESRELKMRASLESLEKDGPSEKSKDDKKKKEKRGMLGGMFKRKDKKGRGQDKDDDVEKTSIDSPRSPTPKESMESLAQEKQAAPVTPQPHRQTSKLQKQPPAKLSPKSSYSAQSQVNVQKHAPTEQLNPLTPKPERAPPLASDSNGSMRIVSQESQVRVDDAPSILQSKTYDSPREALASNSLRDNGAGEFSPFAHSFRSSPPESKPETKGPQARMQMDDFNSTSSSEELLTEPPSARDSHEEAEQEPVSQPTNHHLLVAQAAQHEPHSTSAHPEYSSSTESLSEQPIQIPLPTQQER